MITKSKITRRWLRNSFGVIVAIILLISVIASVAARRYYYNQIDQKLTSEANLIANTFQQYSREGSGNFDEKVRRYVTSFDKREQMELMIVNSYGQTEITSSGFLPEEKAMPDYISATESPYQTGTAIVKLSKDSEKSMLFSRLQPVDEPSISAIRLATSLEAIDRQVFTIILAIFTLAIVVLSLVLFSSYYFIRGIVRPIGEVGETARKIAQGDFGARLEVKYDDEIGDLSAMINYMAEELGTAERMKNDFISSVSHELRTPLTAIQGWGETVLMDKGENQELLEKGMQVIIGETHRLSGMVEELLDFSRMQSGRLKLIKTSINPILELNEAVLMYTQRAAREKIDLKYIQPEKEVTVYADKNRLRQVFINIIDNAIKYSDPEDIVEISTKTDSKELTIIVRDTGIGIAQDDLPQVKEKFYKADSTRRGSGIGLAVAEDIITRHQGTLNVDSQKDVGTTITITLPLYKGADNSAVVDDKPVTIKATEESEII